MNSRTKGGLVVGGALTLVAGTFTAIGVSLGHSTEEPQKADTKAEQTYTVDDCTSTLVAQYHATEDVPTVAEDQGCTSLSKADYKEAVGLAQAEIVLDGFAEDDESEEPSADLSPSDYEITLKTLSKACFGSAGCSLEVQPQLEIVSPGALDTAVDITYEISGGEDGSVIDTISVDESGNYETYGNSVSTTSSASKLTVKITDVE